MGDGEEESGGVSTHAGEMKRSSGVSETAPYAGQFLLERDRRGEVVPPGRGAGPDRRGCLFGRKT